jgi:hypothetical protein
MDLSHSEGPHHHRRERKSDAEQSFFSTLLGGDVLKIYFLASRTRCPRGIAQHETSGASRPLRRGTEIVELPEPFADAVPTGVGLVHQPPLMIQAEVAHRRAKREGGPLRPERATVGKPSERSA